LGTSRHKITSGSHMDMVLGTFRHKINSSNHRS
jgi:hypothetical protein